MNSITIAGNISKTAEVRYTPAGEAVANFSVADNQGKEKQAIFWSCALFGKRADSLAPYLVSGQAVTVSGTISEREWVDKEGNKRKQLDIRVNDVALQGGRKEAAQAPQQRASVPKKSNQQSSAPGFSDMDDDIPFSNPTRGKYCFAF